MKDEIEKDFDQLFSNFSNRELSDSERDKRIEEIRNYLINHGGIVIAAPCQDGILLVSANPRGEKNIFQVYHRIALLGRGRARDCNNIHKMALLLAYGTGISLSKADISVENIVKAISEELDKHFNYLHPQYLRDGRGFYKADFMVAELGFSPKEDFLNMIYADGEIEFKEKFRLCLGILETPVVHGETIIKKKPIRNKDGNFEKDEKGIIKTQDVPCLVQTFSRPVSDGLFALIDELSDAKGFIKSVKEVALFVGVILRLLDERGGRLEMAYLDREMLNKAKSEERRFHHIWQRITVPDPYKPSDPWQDWKKFVAPVYKEAKAGKMSQKLKLLIDFYEIIEKESGPSMKSLLRRMELQKIYSANSNFIKNLFKNDESEPEKEDNNKEE